MKATFIYSEEEVLRAVLAFHNKKITFDAKGYITNARLSSAERSATVYVEDRPPEAVKGKKFNPSLAWSWVKRCALRIG